MNHKKKRWLLWMIGISLIGIGIFLCFIYIKANELPTIKLNGDPIIEIPVFDEYHEQGAKAYLHKKEISNKIVQSGQVNCKKIGTYKITYEITNSFHKKKEIVTRIVKIVDQEKPVLKLKGNQKITLYVGDYYQERGYEAIDTYDGNLTDKVKIRNIVNTKKAEPIKFIIK